MKAGLRHLSAHNIGLTLGIIACAVVGGYAIWYNSAGRFPVFPPIANDYVDLGQAFLHRQLSLLEQPDPQLATLPNPYDYYQRTSITYHWDASYYQGKYYLYWGPVPGLMAAALQGITRVAPTGPLLNLLPYVGLLAVFLGILILLSRYFPGRATGLSLGLFVVLGFMSFPFAFVLGNPRSYEAAILYGQFFLLAGLLAWMISTTGHTSHRSTWLAAAGLSWGLAFSSRYNLAVSVIVYIGFAFVWLQREAKSGALLKQIAILVGPVALCCVGLGIYNYVRFGSPLETGITFQLTLPQLHDTKSYSLSYSEANLYLYLLYPLRWTDKFPFMKPPDFRFSQVPDWLTIPRNRAFEKYTAGILGTVPGIWLLALAIPASILIARSLAKGKTDSRYRFEQWFFFTMIGVAAAAQFLFLVVFFYIAVRYWIDIYLSLVLMEAMLAWRISESMTSTAPLRPVFWSIIAALTLWTAGIYFFACFGVPSKIQPYYDPATIQHLAAFWNPLRARLQALLAAIR